MPRRSTASDHGRRLKAGLALAGLTVAELAAAVPAQYRLSGATIDRIAAGRRQLNDWEFPLLASLLKIPEWFLRDGFAGAPNGGGPDGDRLLAAIGQLRDDLRERDDRFEKTLAQLRDQVSQATAGRPA